MIDNDFSNAARDRDRHYLTPEVVGAAGMSLEQLQRFIGGTFLPDNSHWWRWRCA